MSKPTDDHPIAEAAGAGLALVVYALCRLAWALMRWMRWHPWLTAGLVVTLWMTWQAGAAGAVFLWVGVAAVLRLWRLTYPQSFEDWVAARARSSWRRTWIYKRRWRTVMALTGLWARLDGEELLPPLDGRLCGVRSTRWVDVVSVRLVAGQQPEFWEIRAEALAHSFGALACKVTSPGPGRVVLRFRRRDPLEQTVRPLPVPALADVDLDWVTVGRTEDGPPCQLPVFAAPHLLICGCSKSGKSDVVQEILQRLAPAIHVGLVEVWAIDPKGGMELGPCRDLFTEFARPTLDQGGEPDFTAAVELLEKAVRVMLTRADRCFGDRVRQHTPSRAEPALLVIVDEVARITRYETDKNLAYRAKQAISVLLTQGAAPRVSLIAATQDGRLETVPRDLFPARVAMRLSEAQHVDMVLGDGARAHGALCDKIPATQRGVGYVLLDGEREPTRFRAAWITDDVIADTVARYPAPRHRDVIDTTAADTTQDGGGEGEGMAA